MTRNLTVNGETRRSAAPTIAELVRELGLAPEKVAVERNGVIVPRSTLAEAALAEGDVLEIVHFVGGGSDAGGDDSWSVAGRTFRSRLIVEGASVPVLVDAGVGTASDAAVAMELGCDGVLMNTAIAEAKDPIRMARAMKLAVEAGRDAYLAGRMATRRYADPSSPLAGLI